MRANIKKLIKASDSAGIRKSSIEGDCIHYGITKKDKEGKTKSPVGDKISCSARISVVGPSSK